MSSPEDDTQMNENSRNPWLSPQFFVCRWRIALKTLPIIGAMVGFRFAVWYGANIGGWVEPTVFTTFIVLAVFVSSILLKGVVHDFKEAEKMPSELQSAFWSLTNELEKASKTIKGKTEQRERKFIKDSISAVRDMFICVVQLLDSKDETLISSFGESSKVMRGAEVQLLTRFAQYNTRPKAIGKPIELIRKIFGRMYVIQATSYIPACYSLMDLMVLIVFTVMTTTNWPIKTQFETGLAFTVVITFLFSYISLMVRSLEDPFVYPVNYNMRCYEKKEILKLSMSEEFASVGSIDMSGFCVGFGNHLRHLCDKYDVDPFGKKEEATASHAKKNEEAEKSNGISCEWWIPFSHQWSIVVYTLPVVTVMIGFRLAVWFGGNVGGWVDSQVFRYFISLTTFVTGLMLSGSPRDFPALK